MIRYPHRQYAHEETHYRSTFRLCTLLTIPFVACLLVFWLVTHGVPERVEAFDFIPQSFLFIALAVLVNPFQRYARSGRHRFFRTLARISIGGLAEAHDGKFGDVLLADALTSYARVLGDLYVCFCMYLTKDLPSTAKPNRSCGSGVAVPLIIALPSLMRFRQCLIEFVRAWRSESKVSGKCWQHLANAAKYSSAFPPIYLAVQLKNYSPFVASPLSEITYSRLL